MMQPASITPIDCAVIGTGMKPSVIGGTRPSTTMNGSEKRNEDEVLVFI